MQQAQAQVPMIKEKASASTLTCYLHNRLRLMAELARRPRDQHTLNNIRAYLHIVRSMEERYDLSPLLVPVGEPVGV
jgi:hypothetical protein